VLIRNHSVLGLALRQAHGLRDALKEIDGRCAAKLKRVGAHDLLEPCEPLLDFGFAHVEKQLETVSEIGARDLVESRDIKEQEFFRIVEVFLQQPVPSKASIGVRQDALRFSEADGPDRGRRQHDSRVTRPGGVTQEDCCCIFKQQLVEQMDT
jgi:hypothetical protein